jgi:preprotein translocase subunit SecY
MGDLGRVLVIVGAVVIVVGVVLIAAGRFHLPLGRLPGDIVYRGKRTTFYFPLMTSIVISLVLTLVFWLLGRFGR